MEKKHWNVLVFPGGMENGIEIFNSLRYCKEISLFSASSNFPNQAFYLYQNNHICSDVRSSQWVDELNSIIHDCHIDIVYPANSIVIDALQSKKKLIQTDILLPEDDVLNTTRSKKNTINTLKDVIPTPICYNDIQSVTSFPVFAKPDKGYGSQGATVINDIVALSNIDFNSYIIQELLPGKEYTIDCFSDYNGELLFSSGRERSRIRMGTSMHAEPITTELESYFKNCAIQILKKILITGAWFFQMKEDKDGQLKLLEIDVRIAGTMCYNRCKGVNFPLLSIYNFYKLPVSILENNNYITLDRCLRNRYIFNYEYDTVYIDLDDTIIVDNLVNTDMIKFLYQCINKNKKIILLSKHNGEKTEYLIKYHIKDIFSSIIWLEECDDKYKYIKPDNSIYIDDSFSQRKDVSEKLGIPTFDPSMIECLIDERI